MEREQESQARLAVIKFDRQGQALAYRGNTVIASLVERVSIKQLVDRVQALTSKLSCASKFAVLPRDSMHMTLFTLLREIDRESAVWPDYLDRQADMDRVDQALYQRVRYIPVYNRVKMRVVSVSALRLRLEPVDLKSQEELATYHERVAEATGIYRISSDDYVYHISLAYLLDQLSQADQAQLDQVFSPLQADLSQYDYSFELPVPIFTRFYNMLAYHAYA